MATLRELKGRIGSVKSSEKITGAMKMISSAKMRKAEGALRRLVPYRNQVQTIIGHLLSSDAQCVSPLAEKREVSNVALLVFGSDDGLCGAYNAQIFKTLLSTLNRSIWRRCALYGVSNRQEGSFGNIEARFRYHFSGSRLPAQHPQLALRHKTVH